MRKLYALLAVGVGVVGLTQTALAAPPPVVAYRWTGLYVGAHVGAGWSQTDTVNVNGNAAFPAGTTSSSDQTGILGGLQLGYNWQFAPNWLIGLEGDYSWSGVSGDHSELSPVTPATRVANSHTDIPWMATVTGRFGYVMNNWLFYAKGGVVWARKEIDSLTVNPAAGNLLLTSLPGDETRTGWTAGGGVEVGFADNWSFRVEYDYFDFGSLDESRNATYFNGATGLPVLIRNVDWHMSAVKAALNYRFNWMH